MKEKRLTISHCGQHGFWALCASEVDPDGYGGGRRLTPGKCCGSWPTVREWPIEQIDRKELVEFLGGIWPEESQKR